MDNKFKEFNLNENIIKALNNMKYIEPSQVQKETIPNILKEEDIIVKSQTGSGKTASFGIPLCEKINIEKTYVQALILVPTRELAMQVKEEISNIGRLKKVRVAAVFGKQPMNEQIRELKQRVHIVVGTPGRISDHINRKTLNLEEVKFLVIDEADKMLSMGFIDQIKDILDKISQKRSTALFSATIPNEIEKLCEKYMNKPKVLEIISKVFNRERIEESYLSIEHKDKFKALWKVIYANNPEGSIVFCNTKDKVKEVSSLMKSEGIIIGELHGDMEQKKRLQIIEDFKNKKFKVLIATDVAARGIHIDHIDLVINYEVPMEKESYIHRIGRTGRAGNFGKAISFVSSGEKRFLNQIEEYITYNIKEDEMPDNEKIKVGRKLFKESQRELIKNKQVVKKNIHNDIIKIHINGGKKKKIRALDILGCFSNLPGLTGEDIGIIDIQEGFSYVDILNGKGREILKKYKEVTVKGKKIKIQYAKK
ncbi:DEAD/DEAH box helicase [Clostridium tarantellae]|uniref:ATP-dependent RNA helicase DbpA n=1 Tax=Clostridium tarantellae TaxID=39493 RepID=A0A6I1MM16_9CLOT|nr:DEAD/DEAH box helicase [Clostridium tarantellae]MPQ44536.1 DEAD/DEAH box helicase [Clostridium tarantellae]